MRRCVRSRNLVNEEALAHLGAVASKTNKQIQFNPAYLRTDSAARAPITEAAQDIQIYIGNS